MAYLPIHLHCLLFYGQVSMEVTQNEYRLSPPPGSPSVIYAIMLDCWLADLESRLSFRRAYRRLVAAWDECASAEERVSLFISSRNLSVHLFLANPHPANFHI